MIGIIGAGLSGLLIASRLQEAGIPFKLLEARNRAGGRIHTLRENNTPLEMGATWFAQKHVNLWTLLKELELEPFKQRIQNSFLYQSHLHAKVQKIALPPQEPSYRIAGGTGKIIDALARRFTPESIHFEHVVKAINISNQRVKVITTRGDFEFEALIWCAPPKLFVEQVKIVPALPQQLQEVMQQTHTWMEDSIKLAVTYTKPFWREQGLPTSLFSNEGPIMEFYDHSDKDNQNFALCGFVHPNFNHTDAKTRREKVEKQLVEVFGEEGLNFKGFYETVWQKEDFTGNKQPIGLVPHQNNGHQIFQKPIFEKLHFANTETSPYYGGYMEGAVYSAKKLANQLIENYKQKV